MKDANHLNRGNDNSLLKTKDGNEGYCSALNLW